VVVETVALVRSRLGVAAVAALVNDLLRRSASGWSIGRFTLLPVFWRLRTGWV